MKIEPNAIKVRDLVEGYADNDEQGVRAYDDKLDVRPPYQREFVYKDAQRAAVIDTLAKGYPLNVMYWSVGEDGDFEVIDGQQRTISICQFIESEFAVKAFGNDSLRYFHNLQKDEQERILDYDLTVYLCSGTDSEKLEWFKTINIAGAELTPQELRNAVYSGPWVTAAKAFFSKNGCVAYKIGGDYLRGSAIRQDYLETVIKWISGDDIEGYMAKQQHKPNANDLTLYFQNVMAWVKATFPKYRKEMKTVGWGLLYNRFKDSEYDSATLEKQISELMADPDVTKKGGVYAYLLTGEERHLSIRQFDDKEKREAYERQKGICPACGEYFELEQMQADHITPWSKGGKTVAANCKMLCADDNRKKSAV